MILWDCLFLYNKHSFTLDKGGGAKRFSEPLSICLSKIISGV